MPVPSGVHASASSLPTCHVSCRGSPPVDGTRYTSLLPFRLDVNAIHLPSGEKRGEKSRAKCAVIRRGLLPSASTIQMSS